MTPDHIGCHHILIIPTAKHPYYGDRMFRCARRVRVLCQRRHDMSIRDAFPIWLLSIPCQCTRTAGGYAKRLYRLNPESTREDQLEKNALMALDAIPLILMQQYTVTCIYVINYVLITKKTQGSRIVHADLSMHMTKA